MCYNVDMQSNLLNLTREVIEVYCRNCGTVMNDVDRLCSKCSTKRDEGTKFCQNCGYHTTIKTEYCSNCGAKQKTIVTQKMKNDRFAELQEKEKATKKVQNIIKFFMFISAIAAVLLVLILVFRPQPDNIPDPPNSGTLSPNSFIHDSFLSVGDTYYYSSDISKDVAEYWVQSRNIISYIVTSLIVFIITFIESLVLKSKYKKIRKALKEAK